MSWWNSLGNTVEGWFGKGHKDSNASSTPPDPEAPIKNLIKNAPMPGGQLGENQRMKRELLDGTFQKGGHVRKTGIYKLHKGEYVLTKKKVEMARKMGTSHLYRGT